MKGAEAETARLAHEPPGPAGPEQPQGGLGVLGDGPLVPAAQPLKAERRNSPMVPAKMIESPSLRAGIEVTKKYL
jgi:hypothetical protein